MGGGISQQELVKQVDDIVANVFVNIALYCNTDDIATQTINITCDVQGVVSNLGSIYELNTTCEECFDTVVNRHLEYYGFQRELWKKGIQTPGVQKPIDSDYQNAINQFILCASSCKACDVENVSQKTVIKSVLNCQAFNNVKNSINQQLMTSIAQKLTNNQDMLAPLAEMLGASTTNDVIINLTNRISAKLTDNVISNISQQISSNQVINIDITGSNITGQTQDSAYHSVLTYLGTTNIMNTILSDEQWKVLQTLINDQNTINSLGNTVVKAVSYFSKMLDNVVGQVVFFVLVLVAVVFVGIVLYVITKLIRKALKKEKDHQMAAAIKADHVSAFETF